MEMPARLGVVALDEGQGDDERPPEALVDRMGYWVDLTSIGWREIEGAAYSADELNAARAKLGDVEVEASFIEALVVVAARLGVASLRAPLFALRAARALAALRGGVCIEDDDVALAASLVLAPRATRSPAQDDSEPEPEPESEPPPPPDDAEEPSDPSEPQDDTMPDLDDLVLAAAQAAIPPDLLARIEAGASRRRKSSSDGKSGAFSISKLRGRPTEARAGTLQEGRLSLVATLRAAAPWQRVRGGGSPAAGGSRLQIKPEDFRIVRYRQRRGATTVFVLDASGSSAMQRLAEVKGAIELLLADCYIRRDSVALVAFRGRDAEIVLPPTRSTARARRALAGLPAGGGTPIANGLDVALALADQIQHKGQTPLARSDDGRSRQYCPRWNAGAAAGASRRHRRGTAHPRRWRLRVGDRHFARRLRGPMRPACSSPKRCRPFMSNCPMRTPPWSTRPCGPPQDREGAAVGAPSEKSRFRPRRRGLAELRVKPFR